MPRRVNIFETMGPYALGEFLFICKNICHQFHFTSADAGFDSYQILSNTTKLQKRRRPASEQDKFLSNENLVETKFVFIFGRANQILSA